MNKRNVTISLSISLLNKINDLSRKELPNKSILIEKLLEKWLKEKDENSSN